MADKMNSMPKHVVSSTLTDPQWNTTVIDGSGDVVAAISALRSADGGPILVAGSNRLVHTLLLDGLVDQLNLQLFPVSIGKGKRVFPDDQIKLGFTLTNQRVLPSGVMLLEFVPAT
jgi:dihydrofolate reductase